MTTRPLPDGMKKFLARHPEKFDEGWKEKDYSEGEDHPWSYWVYLKRGWANTEVEPWGGMHIIHESSAKEVKRQFLKAKPCTCDDCKS